jgi:class 3 adenylate cyclase
VQRDLPSGTVTFLFTDVEGSTQLLHELGAEGYADVLADWEEIGKHRRVHSAVNEMTRARVRNQIGDAAVAEAVEQGRAMTLDEAVALALEEHDQLQA